MVLRTGHRLPVTIEKWCIAANFKAHRLQNAKSTWMAFYFPSTAWAKSTGLGLILRRDIFVQLLCK
jgi:hypothetical protein